MDVDAGPRVPDWCGLGLAVWLHGLAHESLHLKRDLRGGPALLGKKCYLFDITFLAVAQGEVESGQPASSQAS